MIAYWPWARPISETLRLDGRPDGRRPGGLARQFLPARVIGRIISISNRPA
jgi:hypothetical protein